MNLGKEVIVSEVIVVGLIWRGTYYRHIWSPEYWIVDELNQSVNEEECVGVIHAVSEQDCEEKEAKSYSKHSYHQQTSRILAEVKSVFIGLGDEVQTHTQNHDLPITNSYY